jgi:hypothetical protein
MPRSIPSPVLRGNLIAAGCILLGLFLPGTFLLAEETRPRVPVPAGGGAKAGAKPGATKPMPAAPAAESPEAEEAADATAGDAGEPFAQKIVRFIRGYALWIIAVLAAAFFVIAGWAWLASRKGGGTNDMAEIGLGEQAPRPATPPSRRFSSTKIAAADVNRRLSGAVTTTEVETDREYALVVDEEDLKMPPLPEEEAAAQQADSPAIEKLLAAKDLDGAYKEYQRQVDRSGSLIFDPRVEMALGDHLLRSRDHEKAARVLEHHVATQDEKDVRPDAYFNLGYIHFMNGTMKKASRFLKLFIKIEKNPVHVDRARRILAKIESASSAG